ncbi:hypothetical protein [Emticicia soli]|uniref:Uncharacterized protein n=1 Tax=Emticicia soli TaxID=2027878 RepID=A0ABW5J5K5_9BACT
MNSNLFIIELKKINCFLRILVNDIPVFSHMGAKVLEMKIPINQFLINGSNNIEIVVLPSMDNATISDNTICKISIKNTNKDLPILEYSTPDFSGKSEKYFDKKIEFSLTISKNPYFINTPDLNESFEQEIYNFYKKIWDICNRKQVTEFFELHEFKDLEIAAYYNLTYRERVDDLRPVFERILADKEMKLQPLDFSKFKITYYHNNKIVTIEDDLNNPVIYFESNDDQVTSKFKIPVFLCLNETKQLIIIR